MPRLVDIKTLSAETGLPVRSIRTLMVQRKLTYRKLSRKMLRFDPERVAKDLAKFDVEAVS